VGTLYNYYASKPELFLAVVRRWRTDLLSALGKELASDVPRREKILAVLRRLYADVSGWQGIWQEFLRGREERSQFMEIKSKNNTGHPWGLGPEELELLRTFETLLTGKPCTDTVARWAYVTITATLQLAARYPDLREENWKFIEELVDKL
jgi:AcrR family transcriptional regulator